MAPPPCRELATAAANRTATRPVDDGPACRTARSARNRRIDCHGQAEQKTFATPDETRTFERGRVEIVHVAGSDIGRLTLDPGWRWSSHVKHIAGTDLCEAPHFQYQVAGSLHIEMADGRVLECSAGDVVAVPEGHDAWVVGDQPVVLVDWWGASDYAKA